MGLAHRCRSRPVHSAACRALVAPQHIGKASGTFTMVRQLGGALAVAVFARRGSYASAQTFSSGYGPALGICATLALAGSVAGLLAPSRPGTSQPPVTAPAASRQQTQAQTPKTR